MTMNIKAIFVLLMAAGVIGFILLYGAAEWQFWAFNLPLNFIVAAFVFYILPPTKKGKSY